MNLRTEYRLDLIFSGPLISQAAGTLEFGVDTAMQRYREQPVINGSLVKGNIRSTLEEFSELLDHSLDENILRWFGPKTNNQDEKDTTPEQHNYLSRRATVDFDCFWSLQSVDVSQDSGIKRTRIAMGDTPGKVNEGSLQVIEDCFPTGTQPVTFGGKLIIRFRRNGDKREFIEWLGKALDYIPAMGSFKGIGFGKLESWKLIESNCKKSDSVKLPSLPTGVTRFGIAISIDRPFCLGRPRTPGSNRIVSEEAINGNVIKALIAQEYGNDSRKLNESLCFDDLIISQALPSDKSTPHRRAPIPLSLALMGDTIVDMSSASAEPETSDFPQTPAFQPDWKPAQERFINTALARSPTNICRYLMVRTEINHKLGISEENRLFSLECIDPQSYVWCANIELCQIPKEKQVATFSKLQEIFSKGLIGMGKTKATLEIQIVSPFNAPIDRIPPWRDDLYIVTLLTSARLLPSNLQLDGVNSYSDLARVYAQYWQQQHHNIKLETYFAQQQLAGSYYFQRMNHHESNYLPEWLTVGGSVFILKITDSEALEKLKSWQKTGLPAHINTDGSNADWRSTPYLPEHGYGEIIVNDPKQLDLLYSAEQAEA